MLQTALPPSDMDQPSPLQAPKPREYSLSGVRTAPVEELARIASTLTEAELRICLQLQAMASAPHFSVRVSSRRLAVLTGLARSNVVVAIDNLSAKKLLCIREGTATTASAYGLNWCLVRSIQGGPVAGPPPSAEVDLQQGHHRSCFETTPGPVSGPPPTGNTGLSSDPASLDSSTSFDGLIDQVLGARPTHFHTAELDRCRQRIFGFFLKWAEVHGFQPPAAPEPLILAQLLTAARSFDRLDVLLLDLHAERTKPGILSPYAWLLTVVMQRFHAVTPAELSARRDARKNAKRAALGLRVVAPTAPPDPQQFELTAPGDELAPADIDVAALAARKGFPERR